MKKPIDKFCFKNSFLFLGIIIYIYIYPFRFVYCQNHDFLQKNNTNENTTVLKNVNVNLHNGKLNISLPINNYIGKELNLPITIDYLSNGVRVDQVANNVGLGWKLNVGGNITRITSNVPDDYQTENTDFNCEIKESINILHNITLDYYQLNALGIMDVFRYNQEPTLTHQLASQLNPKNKIKCFDYSNENYSDDYQAVNGSGYWIFTNEDGTTFYFGQNNAIETISTNSSSFINCQGFNNVSTNNWLLTKIISKNKLDIYEFNYQNMNWESDLSNNGEGYSINDYTSTKTSSYKLSTQEITEIRHNNVKIVSFNYASRDDLKFVGGSQVGNKLTEILFYNFKSENYYKKIIFNYSYFGKPESPNIFEKRLKLDSMSLYGNNNNLSNIEGDKYLFEYINPLNIPSLTSYARDYLGLYNEMNSNQNLIPSGSVSTASSVVECLNELVGRNYNFEASLAGTLQKIIYPNKGYQIFEYEQNALKGGYGHKMIPDQYSYPTTVNDYCTVGPCGISDNIPPNYSTINPLMINVLFNNYPGHNINTSANHQICFRVKTALLKVNEAKSLLLKGEGNGIYMIQKIGNCLDENNALQDDCFEVGSQGAYNPCLLPTNFLSYLGNGFELPQNFVSGGLLYGGFQDIEKHFDSGNYQVTVWMYETETGGEAKLQIYDYITTPILSIPAHFENMDIISEKVDGFRIKSISEFSKMDLRTAKKEFKYKGIVTNYVNNYRDAFQLKITSRGYFDLENVYYDTVYEVQEIEGINNGFVENIFIPRKKLLYEIYGNENSTNDNIFYSTSPIGNYFYPRQIPDLDEINYYRTFDVCDHTYISGITYPFTVHNVNIDEPLYTYFNAFDTNKLMRKRIFNKNEKLIHEENFSYTFIPFATDEFNINKNYYSVLRWKHVVDIPNPEDKNSFLSKSYRYNYLNMDEEAGIKGSYLLGGIEDIGFEDIGFEYGYLDTSIPNFEHLKNKITTESNNYSSTKYIYSPLAGQFLGNPVTRYLVTEIQHQEDNVPALEPKTRMEYDTEGNMVSTVQVTPGTITNNQWDSFIYGYDNRFVVAKLTGIKYSDIPPALIADIKTASNQAITPASILAMETALNALRNSSDTNVAAAQITTTTYNPVYGMLSITDPKGYTVYTEYDAFGRVKLTKEKAADGSFKILSEQQYNTRPE